MALSAAFGDLDHTPSFQETQDIFMSISWSCSYDIDYAVYQPFVDTLQEALLLFRSENPGADQ